MNAIEHDTKLKAVKIKPECGELEEEFAEILAADYKKIACLVSAKEEVIVTINTFDKKVCIKTKGKIKEATIKPEGCKMKWDGLDFTSDQYKQLASIVKDDRQVTILIEPAQGEFDFGGDNT